MNSTADARSFAGALARFADEEWFTPIQIARKLGYATDKPVRNAIKRGELRAILAPCRRRLIVAESDLLRWLAELTYEPRARAAAPASVDVGRQNGRGGPRRHMPTLDYDATKRARR